MKTIDQVLRIIDIEDILHFLLPVFGDSYLQVLIISYYQNSMTFIIANVSIWKYIYYILLPLFKDDILIIVFHYYLKIY